MQNKDLNIGALCSLAVFIVINVVMWLGTPLITGTALLRAVIIALVLYLAPILLAYFRIQFAYHILGFIMILYTISFITSVTLISDADLDWWVRIANLVLGILGVLISIVWFRIVFKNSQKRIEQRLQNKKK